MDLIGSEETEILSEKEIVSSSKIAISVGEVVIKQAFSWLSHSISLGYHSNSATCWYTFEEASTKKDYNHTHRNDRKKEEVIFICGEGFIDLFRNL